MSPTQQATAPLPSAPYTELPDPGLSVERRDRKLGTTLTLVGELDLATVPLLDLAVRQCLRADIRTIDLDLDRLTFCDVSGLNALLDASWLTTAAGGRLRLEHPCPMLTRLIALTGTRRHLAVGIDEGIHSMLPTATGTGGRARERFMPGARIAG